ncbi:MAG: hypothetical protein LBR53_06610, partial [Deltaproteobacteria bacterium]|nr:hypothetical protein [Deltaproteobacteria bacterium]
MSSSKKVSQVVVKVPCPDRMIEVRVTPPDSKLDVRILNEGDTLEVKILPRGKQIAVKVTPADEDFELVKDSDHPAEKGKAAGDATRGSSASPAPSSNPPVTGNTFLGVEVHELKVEDLSQLDAPEAAREGASGVVSSKNQAPETKPDESGRFYEEDSSFPLIQAPLAALEDSSGGEAFGEGLASVAAGEAAAPEGAAGEAPPTGYEFDEKTIAEANLLLEGLGQPPVAAAPAFAGEESSETSETFETPRPDDGSPGEASPTGYEFDEKTIAEANLLLEGLGQPPVA